MAGVLHAQDRRQIHWARTEGVGRLIEEDRLDPRERLRPPSQGRWRRRHGLPPGAPSPCTSSGCSARGPTCSCVGRPRPEARSATRTTASVPRFRLRRTTSSRPPSGTAASLGLVKPLCDSHCSTTSSTWGLPRGTWALGLPRTVSRVPGPRSPSSGRPTSWPCVTSPPARVRHRWQGERLPQASRSSSSSRSISTR